MNLFFRATKFCLQNCIVDHQCSKPEICLKSQCQKGCLNNKHCNNEQKCFKNECHQDCSSDSCPPKKYCHIDTKVCLEKCTSDEDCWYYNFSWYRTVKEKTNYTSPFFNHKLELIFVLILTESIYQRV